MKINLETIYMLNTIKSNISNFLVQLKGAEKKKAREELQRFLKEEK